MQHHEIQLDTIQVDISSTSSLNNHQNLHPTTNDEINRTTYCEDTLITNTISNKVRGDYLSSASSKQKKAPYKVLICSWNVGNAEPPKSNAILNEWIPEYGGGYDIIAIGLQESTYARSVLSNNNSTHPEMKDEKCTNIIEVNKSIENSGFNRTFETENVTENSIIPTISQSNEVNADEELMGKCEAIDESDFSSDDGDVEYDDMVNIEDVEANNSIESLGPNDVIVKQYKTKRSIRVIKKKVDILRKSLEDTYTEATDCAFIRQIAIHLGESYTLVSRAELMEMRLFIYVLNCHPVTAVSKVCVPTGLGSVLGNKGGLIITFNIRYTSFCFVSCHLAAHEAQKFVDKRNNDCATILSSSIGIKHVPIDYQFDHCFFFGDLNYRVNLQQNDKTSTELNSPSKSMSNYTEANDTGTIANLTAVTKKKRVRKYEKQFSHDQHFADVLKLIKLENWQVLNENDQLHYEIQCGRTLTGWHLPPANFPPTFKRQRNSLLEYNAERIPSYCDRILYRSLPGRNHLLSLKSFESVEIFSTSDHKPIRATFEVSPTPCVSFSSLTVKQTTMIEFQDVCAHDLLNMDLTGLSDPYILFRTIPSEALYLIEGESPPVSTTKFSTLTPVWDDNQLPHIKIRCSEERDVRLIHLVFQMMDYDATSNDDALGSAVLSLDSYFAENSEYVQFSEPIIFHSKVAGNISGKIKIQLPNQIDSQIQEKAAETAIPVARCHCAII